MDDTNREVKTSHEFQENSYPISDLIPLSTKTIRDYDKEFQDLKRENFNLKLRIYFLEEQNQINVDDNEYQTPTSYTQQLQNRNEGLRQRLQPQLDPTTYNFDYEDERRALQDELEKYRRENDFLRQSFQLNSTKISSDEQEKLPTIKSYDSGFGTGAAGMSSTFLSSSTLQFELNESKERERKLQEKINLLKKQLESSIPQTNETLAELDRARRQIQQYEVDIKNYEQRQSKAERVLQRLQTEYESRIAHLVEQQQQQTADFETYRHEQEQTSSNFNIEEYRQAIDNRDRIIHQLEEEINEVTTRLRTPFTSMLPFQSSTSDWTDERSQHLIEELNTQMKTHLETVDQLRAECDELRRGETHLRNQIDSLTNLINTPTRYSGLPPLPRPSSKTIDSIQDAQQIEDLQTAVVQITLQLQTDAENVSGLTNRVAQIIRDRDEWQDRINRLQEEIEEKNAHIRQLEKREPEVESRIRQQYILQIEILQRDVQSLQEQLKDRDRILNEYKNEREEIRIKSRTDYEKFDNVQNQERQNLQEQLQTTNNRLLDLQEQLADEQRRFNDLQINYEKIKTSAVNQVEQFERGIQQQSIQIEEFNLQIRQIETNFQTERRQLERERDLEREKNIEIQNTFEITKRRFTDLQNDYDREKNQSDDEKESLRRENQTIRTRLRDFENTAIELTRKNDEFKSQVSVYENRFRDNDDIDKRHRNEINKLQRDIEDISRENEDRAHEINRLQRDIQDISRENEDRTQEINEWRRKYEILTTDLNNSVYEKERIQSENQSIHTENAKLKHDIDELAVQIRLKIQQEFEEEYHQVILSKEKDVQNLQKDNEAIRSDFEQLNNETTRLADQLQIVQNHLKQANDTIDNFEIDMDRLRQTLKISEEKNENIEQDIIRAYTDELKMKTDRLQDVENKYRSIEIQLNQYEKTVYDLREENTKLHDQLERQRDADDTTEKNLTAFEERVRKEVIQLTENKQELIDRLENELREKDQIIKKLEHARSSYEPRDLKLELEIGIEQDVEKRDFSINTYTERDQQIVKVDNTNTVIIERLREDLQNRERQIERILNEKKTAINECEHHISELQIIIRDREREVNNTNDKLQQLQRELEDYRQQRDSLTANLNIVIEENKAYSEQIEKMSQNRNTTSEQFAQYQNTIDDLKSRLRQREDSIQSLQRTIADSDRDLRESRQTHSTLQSDYNRAQAHYEQMEKQYKYDLEKRDQTITSLQKKITEKDQEINKLRENDLSRETSVVKSRSKSRESDQDSRSEYSGARAPTNVLLTLELQKKDDRINELERELDRIRREKSPTRRDDSSIVQHAQRVEIRPRTQSGRFDHLNREELLYELEMTLQDNEGLVQQLAKKSPNITELHNQLLDIRKELARQKYVNQVLWRKLDALIDIQGSNTRAELAIELANYHDELEALKAKQHRANDARAAILNPLSRSSSDGSIKLPSKDNQLQEKIIQLKQQLVYYEKQSRYYYRELMKYHKLLHDAGLVDPSSNRQRRYSTEDFNEKSSVIIKFNEQNTYLYDNKNIEELQEIIRNQNKYIQQLQIRIRINTPADEFNKLYKTIEFNQKTLQQYENVIKQQQNYIDQINKSTNRYEKLSKKHIRHPSILSEQNQNKPDDLIINLDIDILPTNNNKKQTSLNKKDSGVDSVIESTRYTITQQEYQRQINDKDDQIKQLTKQINDLKKVHENEINQYRLKSEKAHTDLIDDLDSKQNDLRQAHLQIDLLKSSKTQLEQAQDQNKRLHTEIKLLQSELTSKNDLIIHYEKQISLLEKQISSLDRGTGEMAIRTSEMSELLEEMRRLRRDLERSINKQNELQAKLDENLRLTRTPREFTFSGRGVSYPDLRIIDTSGLVGTENLSFTTITDEKRSRPLGSSTTELDIESTYPVKMYIVGELENHENLRRLIADLRIELKALEVKIKEKLRSKFTSSLTEPSIEWLEHRLKTVTQCLTRLEETYQLIELYWKANLPIKNKYDEHSFNDPRLANENRELKIAQSKYIQELHNVRQKFKEQSIYMDQVLAQLTKSNNKKANADDYLALLLRPTLDILQKARSNMEHHLKESNNPSSILSDSIQIQRLQRTNRLD